MKKLLVVKYGDINRLLSNKKNHIKEFNHINVRSTRLQKVSYIKKFCEVLEQIQTLVDLNVDTYPAMATEIFSHSNVMELSALLPEFLYNKFTERYVQTRKKNDGEHVPGSESFLLLLNLLKDLQCSLEFAMENYNVKQDAGEKKDEQRKFNTLNKEKKEKSKSSVLFTNKSKFGDDRLFKCTCFVHTDIIKKVNDCPTGKCPVFLGMKPLERLNCAKNRSICEVCFLYKCKKRSPSKCFYKDQMQKILICTGCESKGTERNVLLCGEHKNDSPQVRLALKSFLADFEDGTAITMMQLCPQLRIDPECTIMKAEATETPILTSRLEKRENTNAYDISTGGLVPKEDVAHKTNPESKDYAIYPMQMINISGQRSLILFDSGAMGEAVKADLAERVGMSIIDNRPQSFRVAGGDIVNTNNPLYEATLGPDTRGEYHTFSLLGMDKISEALPAVDLSEMADEFRKNQVSSPLSKEPLPSFTGGSDIHLIIGIRQSRLFPTRLMVLGSGLQIWRSQISDIYGSTLIFAGPHACVKRAYATLNMASIEESFSLLFTSKYNLFREHLGIESTEDKAHKGSNGSTVTGDFEDLNFFMPIQSLGPSSGTIECDPTNHDDDKNNESIPFKLLMESVCSSAESDDPLHNVTTSKTSGIPPPRSLGAVPSAAPSLSTIPLALNERVCVSCMKCDLCEQQIKEFNAKSRVPRTLEKLFQDEEEAGCTVDYRCSSCSECSECKKSERMRPISIREEAEEVLIGKSVKIDLEAHRTTCVYPFIEKPEVYLPKKWGGAMNNYRMAESVLNSQRNKSEEVRASVLRFHAEIHEKGFVAPLLSLPASIQDMINSAVFLHYFCWRSIFKVSESTPARLVVDPTVSSFNDILAKGVNCLTSLYTIVLEWRSHLYAFTSDISKMFNSVKLEPEMYKYSLYLFSKNLTPGEPIEVWVNLTLMYGLVSAANQCTRGMRDVANAKQVEYPLAHHVVTKTTYMDDSSGGHNKKEIFDRLVEEMKELLPLGGFHLKVVTISGEDPSEKASSDGVSTTFAGYKWLPKEDLIMLNSSDLNFNPKRRGIKKPNDFPIDSEEDVDKLVDGRKLTRRILLGKTLEMFDILGLWEPLKVRLKLDLQPLKMMDYDEIIPEELRPRWVENLKMIHGAKLLQCKRAFVPKDAVNPDEIELLILSDAATSMCGVAVYARFRLADDSYSCQLITARSKTTQASIPRNELEGCSLAAQTGYTVARALGPKVVDAVFACDSTISVCWITNPENKLKQFVNARVKLIHRLVGAERFYHIAGEKNPSDLLTRGNVNCGDVDKGSRWFTGDPWMKLQFKDMPLSTYADICSGLSDVDKEAIQRESHPTIPVSLKLVDPDPIHYTIEPQVIVLPDSKGNFCCESTARRAKCHCVEQQCCLCLYPPADEHSVGSQYCQIRNVCTNIRSPTTDKEERPSTESTKAKNGYMVDFIHFGFKRAFLQLAYVLRFVTRVRHRVHQKKGLMYSDECKMCKVLSDFKTRGLDKLGFSEHKVKFADPAGSQTSSGPRIVVCSPLDFHSAWHYVCRTSTERVKAEYCTKPRKLKEYEEKEHVLFGAGRLSYPDVHTRDSTEIPLFHDIDYFQPVFLASDVLTYAIVMYVHWVLCPHSGIERTMSMVLRIIHVEKLRKLVKYVRETCPRCRYLMKKHYIPATGNQALYSLMRAPPFFSCMIDIAGTFDAHDSIKQRVTKEAFFLVQVCMVTGAVAIGVLEDLTTMSIVMSLSRSAYRFGWSKYLLVDNQTSFKTLEKMKLSFKDVQGKLWKDQKLILDFSTPLAHNEHGRVESKVKVLKDFLTKSGELGKKHSYLEWETICLNISAAINGLPICHNQDDKHADDSLGLITPNMFLIGRNNSRSPEGFVKIEHNPIKALRNLSESSSMLLDLLGDYVHRFIPGKRLAEGQCPDIDDIVLFVIKESERSRNIKYRYGRIIKTDVHGRGNKVRIRYRNSSEAISREVDRNVKDIVLIQGSDEIDFNSLEHCLAANIQKRYL
jgi:hypothetical protein